MLCLEQKCNKNWNLSIITVGFKCSPSHVWLVVCLVQFFLTCSYFFKSLCKWSKWLSVFSFTPVFSSPSNSRWSSHLLLMITLYKLHLGFIYAWFYGLFSQFVQLWSSLNGLKCSKIQPVIKLLDTLTWKRLCHSSMEKQYKMHKSLWQQRQ